MSNDGIAKMIAVIGSTVVAALMIVSAMSSGESAPDQTPSTPASVIPHAPSTQGHAS